jgi:hypothetical protein
MAGGGVLVLLVEEKDLIEFLVISLGSFLEKLRSAL